MNNQQPLKVIKTPEQYQAYLSEIEMLLSKVLVPGSPESDRLDVLSVLIDSYERSNFPIEPVSPIDAIKFRMGEMGLKQVDLAPYFGSKSRVSEVLSGKKAPHCCDDKVFVYRSWDCSSNTSWSRK